MIWIFLAVGSAVAAIVIAIARANSQRSAGPAGTRGRSESDSSDSYVSSSDNGAIFWSSSSGTDGSGEAGDGGTCGAGSSGDSFSSDCSSSDSGSGGSDSGSSSSD